MNIFVVSDINKREKFNKCSINNTGYNPSYILLVKYGINHYNCARSN